mmetsp:Transcript_90675/g.259350  ORF Transcript_90675/g.259350 Transcript_90675/m.259350 type:complete len:242 (+) Transcript_90675:1786-2511(+)
MPQDPHHRADFHSISKKSAIAIALRGVDVKAGQLPRPDGHGDTLLLCRPIRCEEAGAPAIVIRRGACDDSDQLVVFLHDDFIVNHLGKSVQCHVGDIIAKNHPIASGIKCETPALAGGDAHSLTLRPEIRGQVQLHSANDGEGIHSQATSSLQALATQVDSNCGSSIFSIDRKTGTSHTKTEVETVRTNGRGAARCSEGALSGLVVRLLHEVEVGRLCAEAQIHTTGGVHDLPLLVPAFDE